MKWLKFAWDRQVELLTLWQYDINCRISQEKNQEETKVLEESRALVNLHILQVYYAVSN